MAGMAWHRLAAPERELARVAGRLLRQLPPRSAQASSAPCFTSSEYAFLVLKKRFRGKIFFWAPPRPRTPRDVRARQVWCTPGSDRL